MKIGPGEGLVVILGGSKFAFEYHEGDDITETDIENLRATVTDLIATETTIRARNTRKNITFDPFGMPADPGADRQDPGYGNDPFGI
jgi:hypothetical protein